MSRNLDEYMRDDSVTKDDDHEVDFEKFRYDSTLESLELGRKMHRQLSEIIRILKRFEHHELPSQPHVRKDTHV